jgi:hypothetical protein
MNDYKEIVYILTDVLTPTEITCLDDLYYQGYTGDCWEQIVYHEYVNMWYDFRFFLLPVDLGTSVFKYIEKDIKGFCKLWLDPKTTKKKEVLEWIEIANK